MSIISVWPLQLSSVTKAQLFLLKLANFVPKIKTAQPIVAPLELVPLRRGVENIVAVKGNQRGHPVRMVKNVKVEFARMRHIAWKSQDWNRICSRVVKPILIAQQNVASMESVHMSSLAIQKKLNRRYWKDMLGRVARKTKSVSLDAVSPICVSQIIPPAALECQLAPSVTQTANAKQAVATNSTVYLLRCAS